MSGVVKFKPKATIKAGSQPDPGRGQRHRPGQTRVRRLRQAGSVGKPGRNPAGWR
jgi:hypothetical protein